MGATGPLSSVTGTANQITVVGSYQVGLATNINGPNSVTLTDYAKASRFVNTQTTLSYAATVVLDFSASDDQTLTLTGNVTFQTANLTYGTNKTIRVVGDSVPRNLAFPAGWIWLNGSMPTAIAGSKNGILSLKSWDSSDANVVAAWAVQV